MRCKHDCEIDRFHCYDHHSFFLQSVTRQLVSLTDPNLFFIDPTLHCIARLYCLGCFGTGSVDEIFGQDVLVFPTREDTAEIPLFSGPGRKKPVSENGMNKLFKKYAIEAGFPSRFL